MPNIRGILALVWYIDGTLQSMRVDRAIRWIGRRVARGADISEGRSW